VGEGRNNKKIETNFTNVGVNAKPGKSCQTQIIVLGNEFIIMIFFLSLCGFSNFNFRFFPAFLYLPKIL
jgi:hypothetical protein